MKIAEAGGTFAHTGGADHKGGLVLRGVFLNEHPGVAKPGLLLG